MVGIVGGKLSRDTIQVLLSNCNNRDLYELMGLGFQELEGRGLVFVLSGPYRAVRGDFPEKATRVAFHLANGGLPVLRDSPPKGESLS